MNYTNATNVMFSYTPLNCFIIVGLFTINMTNFFYIPNIVLITLIKITKTLTY